MSEKLKVAYIDNRFEKETREQCLSKKIKYGCAHKLRNLILTWKLPLAQFTSELSFKLGVN